MAEIKKHGWIYGLLAFLVGCGIPAALPADTSAAEGFEQGLLWSVAKDGEVVGHVFGTFHSNDQRVIRLAESPKVSQLLQQSENFAMEAFPRTRYFNPHWGYRSILSDMMLPDNQKLVDIIGADLYGKVSVLLAKNSVPEDRIPRLKPWAAMHSLGNIPYDDKKTGSKKAGNKIQDHLLFEKAAGRVSDLYQLETLEELVAAYYSFPSDAQIGLLADRAAFYDQTQNNHERMVRSYLEEDLTGMLRWNMAFISPSSVKLQYDKVYLKHVLHIRNVVMAHYMLAPLRAKKVFFAIGALHLQGQKGILAILRDTYGFSVKRVPLQ